MSWQTDLHRAPLATWLLVSAQPTDGEAITRIGYRTARRWHLVGCAPDLPVLAWDHLSPPLRRTR